MCQSLRAAGDVGAAAYRTCFLELMVTVALPVVCAAEGLYVMCGRNASLPSLCCESCRCEVKCLALRFSCEVHSSDWTIRDVRTGALLQLQQFPHNTSPISFCGFCPTHLASRFLCICLSPTMSSQQCLRRLPSALRSSALRAGARSVIRAPAARNYSAISKATSSGLLSQVSRYAVPLICLES